MHHSGSSRLNARLHPTSAPRNHGHGSKPSRITNMIRAGLRGLSRCPRRLNFFWPFDFASAASVDCNLPLPALPGRAFHTAGSPHELPRSYLVYQSRKVNSAASAVCPVPITKLLKLVKNAIVASTSRKFQCVFAAASYSTEFFKTKKTQSNCIESTSFPVLT